MEKLLNILKANQGKYVSGEMLASNSGITRAAIWKQIRYLRGLGYMIDSSPRKGYCLTNTPSTLHPFEFKMGLETKIFGQTIYHQTEVDSTNVWARSLAGEGAMEGTVVIAESQKKGRGRLGRSWDSAPGKGLWFSMILRPKLNTSELASIMILTAVVMSQSIFSVTGVQIQIKWPNDLIYGGRKLGGILAEMNGELDRVNYLVIGIGFNVNHENSDFPPELEERAISLQMITGRTLERKALLAEFLRNFEETYRSFDYKNLKDIIDYAKQHSASLGKMVYISQGSGRILTGVATDLDWDGSLLLKEANGALIRVNSGEIIEAIGD